MTNELFEKLVVEAVEDLPKFFKEKLDNVNFLNSSIDRLVQQFYYNKAQSLNINEVINKIKLIQ